MKNSLEKIIAYADRQREQYKKTLSIKVRSGLATKELAREEYDLACDVCAALEIALNSPTQEIVDKLAAVGDSKTDILIAQLSEITRHVAEKEALKKEIKKLSKENESLQKKIARITQQLNMGVNDENRSKA